MSYSTYFTNKFTCNSLRLRKTFPQNLHLCLPSLWRVIWDDKAYLFGVILPQILQVCGVSKCLRMCLLSCFLCLALKCQALFRNQIPYTSPWVQLKLNECNNNNIMISLPLTANIALQLLIDSGMFDKVM